MASGASIFGGRGSFPGALLGAALIQEIVTASGFRQQTTRGIRSATLEVDTS